MKKPIRIKFKTLVKVHRVFPSCCFNSHLHENLNFTKITLETVRRSLHHSCRSEITRQGTSLPLNRHSYSCRLLTLMTYAIYINISHISAGQVSDPIHHFNVLQSPVFLINSRPLLFCNINKTLFTKLFLLTSHFPKLRD